MHRNAARQDIVAMCSPGSHCNRRARTKSPTPVATSAATPVAARLEACPRFPERGASGCSFALEAATLQPTEHHHINHDGRRACDRKPDRVTLLAQADIDRHHRGRNRCADKCRQSCTAKRVKPRLINRGLLRVRKAAASPRQVIYLREDASAHSSMS